MSQLPNTFEIVIPVAPIGKARPRVTRKGTYTPQVSRDFERIVQMYLTMARPPLLTGAVIVDLDLVFLRPKSAPKSRLLHTVKPDADNVAKAVLDAANGILWVDDAQIVMLRVSKAYGETSCIKLAMSAAYVFRG